MIGDGTRVRPVASREKEGEQELARRNPQTAAKRAREQAKQEKRERKLAKKAAAAAARNEPAQPDTEQPETETASSSDETT